MTQASRHDSKLYIISHHYWHYYSGFYGYVNFFTQALPSKNRQKPEKSQL